MADTVLGGAIELLEDFGFFDVVLPFLLIFTIVFGILEKTKIFGTEEYHGKEVPKKNINAMVAFVIAFFFIAAKEIVNSIKESLPIVGLFLIAIISFLMLVGSFASSKEEFDFKQTDVKQLLMQAKEEMVLTAKLKKIKLTLRFGKDMPKVAADKLRLHQVLNNLIGNAIKFTPEGGAVTISAAKRKNEVVVSVKDTGRGVPKELRDKLFTRFFQAHPMVGEAEGFGLGLAISKEIVEAHGGSIWFESEEGEGSRFSFAVPINRR